MVDYICHRVLCTFIQIERVYRTIKSLRAEVKFSVSPFGLYRPGDSAGMPPPISGFDPYSQLYADTLLWLQKGWVDFMAPQLYWAVNSTHQSYPMLLDWWLKHNPANRCDFGALGVRTGCVIKPDLY